MNKIGIAIVGLGSAVAPHAKSLADLSDRAEVKWAASPTPERTKKFAEQFPFPVTNDIKGAISDPAVDAVLILTPPNTHLEIAQRCFASGKHVLLEKPVEGTLAKAERVVAGAEQAGVRLGVVLQHRFRAGSLRLRALIDEGALGAIEAAAMTVLWWRPQSYYDEPGRGSMARDGGGVLMTQAIHTLDLFRSLVGIAETLAAQVITTGAHRMETEDYASALVRLGNGAPGSILVTTAAYPGYPERIDIIGTKGTACLSGSTLRVDYVDGYEESVVADERTGGGANHMDFAHDAHRALWSDFLDAVRDEREPRASGEEALASQRIIDAILVKGKALSACSPRSN